MSGTFDKIKSFVNLKTYDEEEVDNDDSSSDGLEDHFIRPDTPMHLDDNMMRAEQALIGGNFIDNTTNENVLLQMLEDIRVSTKEILEKETKTENTVFLSDKDMKKIEAIQKRNITEKFDHLKAEIEYNNNENKIQKKNFKQIKYLLIGINTACVVLGVCAFFYYRNNSPADKIIEKMESKSFRATKLTNDSWIFRSQPRGNLPTNIIITEK